MHDRITQLNDLIRDLIGAILMREVSFKSEVIVTVTKVETARNLRRSTISVSVYPVTERTYVLKTIEHEHHNIQRMLHQKMATRPLPLLSFQLDTTEEEADKVERLLFDIHHE